MSTPRFLLPAFSTCAAILLAACGNGGTGATAATAPPPAASAKAGNGRRIQRWILKGTRPAASVTAPK